MFDEFMEWVNQFKKKKKKQIFHSNEKVIETESKIRININKNVDNSDSVKMILVDYCRN